MHNSLTVLFCLFWALVSSEDLPLNERACESLCTPFSGSCAVCVTKKNECESNQPNGGEKCVWCTGDLVKSGGCTGVSTCDTFGFFNTKKYFDTDDCAMFAPAPATSPAPTPNSPAPTPGSPAPTPANSPAPTPADNTNPNPVPTPANAAPTPTIANQSAAPSSGSLPARRTWAMTPAFTVYASSSGGLDMTLLAIIVAGVVLVCCGLVVGLLLVLRATRAPAEVYESRSSHYESFPPTHNTGTFALGGVFVCPFCNAGYEAEVDLNIHMNKRHAGEQLTRHEYASAHYDAAPGVETATGRPRYETAFEPLDGPTNPSSERYETVQMPAVSVPATSLYSSQRSPEKIAF